MRSINKRDRLEQMGKSHLETSTLNKYLWNAISSINGLVDNSKRIEIILPLILYKHISDLFEDELSEQKKKFGDEQAARYAIEVDHQDARRTGRKPILRFYIPERFGWNIIRSHPPNPDLAYFLTQAMHNIAKINPELQGVLDIIDYAERRGGYRVLGDKELAILIDRLSSFRLGRKEVLSNKLSDAFDSLLGKLETKYKGEFLTPKKISQLIIELINPDAESEIYDPACGSAGLLIAARALLYKRNSHNNASNLKLYGQEKNSFIFSVAKTRMILSGDLHYTLALGDSISKPAYLTTTGEDNHSYLKRFDFIVSNLPQGQKYSRHSDYEHDPWGRFIYGIPPKSSADWGWVQHVLTSLKDTGRAAVLLNLGAVSRGSNSKVFSREKDIRERIIANDFIESVILLPEKVLNGLTVPRIILVLNRAKHIERKGKILLVNGSTYVIKEKREWLLADEGIKAVIQCYSRWGEKERISKIITLDEARAADFNLNPLDFIKGARIQYSLFKRGLSESDRNFIPSIFLSHNSQDKPFVRKLAKKLENYGVRVWVDEAEIKIGESLTQKIGQAIEETDYVAVVLSSNSIRSEWVQKELQIAINKEIEKRRVVVLPLLLEPVTVPAFLRDKLYADFTRPENYELSISKLLKDIGVWP
jgi:type I restriction enzyme M protein